MTVVVLTTFRVRDGAIDEVARLFEETNRPLVRDEPDWLGAWSTANRERDQITNIARWWRAASYDRLRNSAEFKEVMGPFAGLFLGPPTPLVNEVLGEMQPLSPA